MNMQNEQYERILNKLERAAELLKDPERAERAANLLRYDNTAELYNDLNAQREAVEGNRLFIVDVLDDIEFKEIEINLPEFEFTVPEINLDGLPEHEELETVYGTLSD